MEEFMNSPVGYERTDEDIIETYNQNKSIKDTAKIWCIPPAEVRKIIKTADIL